MTQTLLWFAAANAFIYLFLTARPVSTVRTATKTLSVAALAAIAAFAGFWLLCLALALCALGDALLSRESDQTFMAGIGAFALGHLAYIVVFLTQPTSDVALIAANLLPLLALIGFGAAMAVLLPPRAGELRGPVLAYIPIILGMGIAALALPATGPLIWVFPAAMSFVASDLILATEKFLLPTGHPLLRITPYAVWPLYWGAQAGFIIAFV
ncbi:YhhN-like protein [Falsiruegeria litorea R37]|uniref:YhhN-like protein n=1 Tax=Falsiruegeria litorea R37 TaxID=1200284 RepID=A0A1Y5T7Y1_9RHOB|nr:lysoplasmalogenase [Falsiruegeria litorea]SLN57891.1 YhhN-like protein [Falsiruegeria litorea R37]